MNDNPYSSSVHVDGTSASGPNCLADFTEGSQLSLHGRRHYELFDDHISFTGCKWGEKYQAKVRVSEMHPETHESITHGTGFRIGTCLALVVGVMMLISFSVFRNDQGLFTYVYVGGSVLVAGLLALAAGSIRSVHVVTFVSQSTLQPILTVVSHRPSTRPQSQAFVDQVKDRLRTVRETPTADNEVPNEH